MPEYWNFRRARPLPKRRKTLIMGIINMTPDSFSGGGEQIPDPHKAVTTGLAMLEAGADILDIGAESSRPGAATISAEEEIARLGETLALLRARSDAPISIDTYHPETAAFALEQGADIINDITALRGGWSAQDSLRGDTAALAARENAHVILMHMPSAPGSMQDSPSYGDIVFEVGEFLRERADFAIKSGINKDCIWLDPGFGFGKNFSHNRELLRRLGEFGGLGYPLVVGLSRKRMIADALGLATNERLEASLALAVMAAMQGAAVVRVHDVKATARAVAMANAIGE